VEARDGTRVVEVKDWEPASQGYRSPALSCTAGYGPTYSPYFDLGTVIALDGKAHLRRRRLLNRLLENSEWLKEHVLVPAVDRNLAELFDNADPDGVTRADLPSFNMRAAQQMAAAVVGLDRAETREGVDELLSLVQKLGKSEAKLELIIEYDIDSVLPRALAARQRIYDHFYAPALELRQERVARYRAGELGDDGLPLDEITLLLLHADEFEIDPDTAFRETLLMLTAGTMTTALGTTWAIHELLDWFDANPEQRHLAGDPDFLQRAFNESLRLHPGLGANLRRAAEDTVLEPATPVHRDDFVLLYKQAANRDTAIFGPNADEFDPFRELPDGVQPYGLSFGNGPHKCLGMPLVIGTKTSDGIALRLLTRLFAAGIRRDPERPPTKFGADHPTYDQWKTYPVIFSTDPRDAPPATGAAFARA
jgi:cytochrome P450